MNPAEPDYSQHPIEARPPNRYALRMKSENKSIALLLLGVAIISLACTSCNTANGLGKDVEKLGDKIQDKAGK